MAMELLSPAGSYESVIAAVRGGADAIYFGAPDFNARRGAKNISEEQLPEVLKYCRLRGVHTYVTVNTLVTDRELLAAQKLIGTLSDAGATAVIVQDLGMARLIRSMAPDLPIHASTQMTVHNLAGAMAAKQLGFSRVVLSRELSLEQIAFITERCGIETEVFCHGALCMCYSGQCYLSAAIGGRSGNRGLCAQPCRLAYSFFGAQPDYHLSLKDLSLCKHLQELERAGVSCLKIEGRMKRPEYVALTASIYKRALREGRAPTAAEMRQLEAVFSRSGFTDGYFMGKKGEDMFGIRSESDSRDSRAIYKEAQQIYQSEPEDPRIAVSFYFFARKGETLRLLCRDENDNEYEAVGAVPEEALTRATTQQEVQEHISKTGGTVFYPDQIEINLDDGLRIPIAAVKALRRQCLEGLAAVRRQPPRRRKGEWQPGLRRLPHNGKQEYIFSFLKWEQLTPALLRQNPAFLYFPLHELCAHLEQAKLLGEKGLRFAAVLPRIIADREWPDVLAKLKQLKQAGINTLVCTNIGQPVLLQPLKFDLRGDFGLNIMNSQSIKELKALGLSSCTLSFEMNFAQIRDISQSLPCEVIAYGRLPLMITENCIIKKRGKTCSCQGSQATLIDKTGRSFPLMREEGCRTTLYNSEKLYLADKQRDLQSLGVQYLRLCFTTENPRECEAAAEAYLSGSGAAMPDRMTRGLYYRGVQ